MRSASHFGTWPPCRGRSALPVLRAMSFPSEFESWRQHLYHRGVWWLRPTLPRSAIALAQESPLLSRGTSPPPARSPEGAKGERRHGSAKEQGALKGEASTGRDAGPVAGKVAG